MMSCRMFCYLVLYVSVLRFEFVCVDLNVAVLEVHWVIILTLQWLILQRSDCFCLL
jgi:hypothetical protein